MTLPVPRLDDTDFDELVETGRAIIPRYAPDWTDHNLHDPGITLLDLLAWIADQQIYQIGFVSDAHIRAFAALLGVRPKDAKPARGLIWPSAEVRSGITREAVVDSSSTRVVCEQQPDLAFLVDGKIHVTRAMCTALHAIGPYGRTVPVPGQLNPSAASFRLAIDDLFLQMTFDRALVADAHDPDHAVAIGVEVDAGKADEKLVGRGPLFVDYQHGMGPWSRADVVKDSTRVLGRTGVILLRVPRVDEDPDRPLQSRLRIRLDRGFYPLPPDIVRVAANVLPIAQIARRPDRVLGTSFGQPAQLCDLDLGYDKLVHTSGRAPSFEIWVGDHQDAWCDREDLEGALPDERCFRLDREAGRIEFGNGVNGMIPDDQRQVRIRNFRVTRGMTGNLAAGRQWRVAGMPVAPRIYGHNPEPLRDGADPWDTERLWANARARILERKVLLSDDDLQQAAKSLAGFGVERADVLSGYHPSMPDLTLPGARSLLLTRRTGSADPSADLPPEDFVERVSSLLVRRKVLGERLTVLAPIAVPIHVTAEILIEDGADSEAIRSRAEERVSARLRVARNHDDIDPWPPGRTVTCTEIRTLLVGIDGVVGVPDCAIGRDNSAPGTQPIRLARREIATVGKFEPTLTMLSNELEAV